MNRGYESQCDSDDTWYGWASNQKGSNSGAISTTFQGEGTATLSFGNCLNQARVKVFLNDKMISEIPNLGTKDVSFDYSVGDKLTIIEDATIWKLYSLSLINCN